jgi:hypothetical protein
MSFRNWLVSFLFVSITFLIVPAGFVHHFFHHSETEDSFFAGDGKVLETKHNHCLILKVEIPEYVVSPEVRTQTYICYPKQLIVEYHNPQLVVIHSDIDPRGPPQVD